MIRTNVPSVVDDVTGCYPPLGLLYVAGAIEQTGRHTVRVVDCVAEGLDVKALEGRLRELAPDVVGIEAITFSIVDSYQAARAAKSVNPSVPVLLGGPHVNLYPEETLALPEVDYLLLGEGETAIGPFLDALQDGGDMTRVPGAVFKDRNGHVFRGAPNPLIGDLDALPMPARHLLDNRRYSSALGKGQYLTTIMSSRGCPAKCIFCDRPHLGKRFRHRSAANVVDEMQQCYEQFGIDEFFFYDDTFTINRERVFDICQTVRERGLKVFWDIRARVATVDREMLAALAEAGCTRIHLGIESGNREVLRIMRKGLDLEKARQVFRWCREVGIETLAYFMLGNPGEGRAELKDTMDYALSIDCDYIHVAVTTPFPGTELYRMGLSEGVYECDYWSAFARDPSQDFVPALWEKTLSREELVAAMFELYRRFYRRPRYILRRLMKIRSWREFAVKAKVGMKLLAAPGSGKALGAGG
jgi:radical SAM superfamily enzyme YgiQ (UPF0313 family)